LKPSLEKGIKLELFADIKGIKYTPTLCRTLKKFPIELFEDAIRQQGSFILQFFPNIQFAISRWVSPKRTRSYPYARVYDTLSFPGKKITIIPFLKDEGKNGDRDFLQWDTISLMSLLGVFTIITYYSDASKHPKSPNKITSQRYDVKHILPQIENLISYQSDALHWNLEQIDRIEGVAEKALESYDKISQKLNIELHSKEEINYRISELIRGKEHFMDLSRKLAQQAQKRESLTMQPKEKIADRKVKITIRNYLGGFYFFTCDEFYTQDDKAYLIESKHSHMKSLPSINDIKDGLLKMILWTNIKESWVGGHSYVPFPILRLTSDIEFSPKLLSPAKKDFLKKLNNEAENNNFYVIINNINLNRLVF